MKTYSDEILGIRKILAVLTEVIELGKNKATEINIKDGEWETDQILEMSSFHWIA